MEILFGVITRIPANPFESHGNLCSAIAVYRADDPDVVIVNPQGGLGGEPGKDWDCAVRPGTHDCGAKEPEADGCFIENFRLGELLLLDGDGREPVGMGRKPSKWDVDCEIFPEIGPAIAMARAVEAAEETPDAPKDE